MHIARVFMVQFLSSKGPISFHTPPSRINWNNIYLCNTGPCRAHYWSLESIIPEAGVGRGHAKYYYTILYYIVKTLYY